MNDDMREKLERMLESGEITNEMYEEMKSRWNGEKEEDHEDKNDRVDTGDSGKRSIIRISGSGTLTNPDANEIHISGSGRIEGSLRADRMKVSGSAKIEGSARISDELSSSGSIKLGGELICGKVDSSGAISASSMKIKDFNSSGGATIKEEIESELIHSSGMLNASEITCQELEISGIVKAENVSCKKIKAQGAFTSSSVKSEFFELQSMGWETKIESLHSDVVAISPKKRILLSNYQAKIGEIKGRKVEIEGVKCGRIMADMVVIGDNCTVDYVEAEKISISDGASVKEKKITGKSE